MYIIRYYITIISLLYYYITYYITASSQAGIGMTCSTYLVQPGTYHLVLCYSIILTCTAPFEYVLFIPSTYSVRTTFYCDPEYYLLGSYFSLANK
jgi:hypothetical protein